MFLQYRSSYPGAINRVNISRPISLQNYLEYTANWVLLGTPEATIYI